MNGISWKEYNSYVDLSKCPDKDDHRWVSMEDSYPPLNDELKNHLGALLGDSVTIEAFKDNDDISYECFYRMIHPQYHNEDLVFIRCCDMHFDEIKYWRWAYPAPENEGYNVG